MRRRRVAAQNPGHAKVIGSPQRERIGLELIVVEQDRAAGRVSRPRAVNPGRLPGMDERSHSGPGQRVAKLYLFRHHVRGQLLRAVDF